MTLRCHNLMTYFLLLGYFSSAILVWYLLPLKYGIPKSSPDTFRYKYQKYLGIPLIAPL